MAVAVVWGKTVAAINHVRHYKSGSMEISRQDVWNPNVTVRVVGLMGFERREWRREDVIVFSDFACCVYDGSKRAERLKVHKLEPGIQPMSGNPRTLCSLGTLPCCIPQLYSREPFLITGRETFESVDTCKSAINNHINCAVLVVEKQSNLFETIFQLGSQDRLSSIIPAFI